MTKGEGLAMTIQVAKRPQLLLFPEQMPSRAYLPHQPW
jgi:hypothetical protein